MTQYVGIDVHKETSQIAVIDGERDIFVLDKSIRSWPRRFKAELALFASAKVLIEASTVSRWIGPYLRSLGFEVIVGDPNNALMYASRSTICKNDRNDARALALACKHGHFTAVYEPTAEQQPIAELLGTRTAQVRRRTAAINRTRALYSARGEDLGGREADAFWSRVKRRPANQRVSAAEPLLDELAMLEDLISASEKKLDETAANHPVVSRLMTVPGVGPNVALAFYVKIGDPTRFQTARQVESYLGLVPKISASAGPGEGVRLSKRGSSEVRALLGQAAWSHVRSNDPKAEPIRDWFLKLEQRRSTGKAIVAVTRRLAGILFALMRDGTVFETRAPRPAVTPAPTRRYKLKSSSPVAT